MEVTTYSSETLKVLKDCNSIFEDDHFVYVSGHHGSGWIDKDIIFSAPKRVKKLADFLAHKVRNLKPDVICAPAIGGIIVTQWVAYHLDILCCFSEHGTGSEPDKSYQKIKAPFILKRGYDRLVSGRRVLIVDDIVNMGFSVLSTSEAVRRAGGNVVGIAALISRGNVKPEELKVDEFICLLEYRIPAWPESRCSLCKDRIPINTDYGHGKEFVEKHKGDKVYKLIED